jgi:glycosyltransferase involved in cell wall biosynthesis
MPTLLKEISVMYESFVEENKIDVVHAHNFHHFVPSHALALTDLRRQGLPTVLTIHEVWSEFICEDLLKRSEWDAIVTVSRHVAEGILQQAPHLTNLQLVYHGIDTALFSPRSTDGRWAEKLSLDGRPAIIHPARMLPWKGVTDSVKAMALVREEFPIAVLIITDTEDIVDWIGELKGYREEVLATIRELNLKDNVITQPFPYLDLPGVYNHCQVVIYPTIGEEPFGLVPVEAMACEKPVIVTKSGGLVESVINGETGFIIDKGDVAALAEKICNLLRDKDTARHLGKAGRKHVLKHFNRARMAHEMVDIYEGVAAKNMVQM